MAGIIAERLMVLEEKSMVVLDGSELPPECDRVHTTHIHSGPLMNSDTQIHFVTHYCKPNGLDGPWKTLHEEIQLARSNQATNHTFLPDRRLDYV